MKTVTTTYNLYSFNELAPDVQQKIIERERQYLLEDPDKTDIFSDMIETEYKEEFPHSELSVQYSLCYCQGDGLNTYGTVTIEDMKKHIIINPVLLQFFNEIDFTYFYLPENRTLYSYSYADRFDLIQAIEIDNQHDIETIIENSTFYNNKNMILEELENLNDQICSFWTIFNEHWERKGYNFFYVITDEDVLEFIEANMGLDVECFTEDGQYYI